MLKGALRVVILLIVLPGCAHDAEWLSRRPPERLATVGQDTRKVPPGQSIPPSGMGVDLQ
jgi:hypothetical protein